MALRSKWLSSCIFATALSILSLSAIPGHWKANYRTTKLVVVNIDIMLDMPDISSLLGTPLACWYTITTGNTPATVLPEFYDHMYRHFPHTLPSSPYVYDSVGYYIPPIMQQWITGHADSANILHQLNKEMKRHKIPDAEQKAVRKLASITLSEERAPEYIYGFEDGIILCKRIIDAAAITSQPDAMPNHTVALFGNMNNTYLQALRRNLTFAPIFRRTNKHADCCHLVTAEDLDAPAPEAFLALQEKYDIPAHECLLIDTNEYNLATARYYGWNTMCLNPDDPEPVYEVLRASNLVT